MIEEIIWEHRNCKPLIRRFKLPKTILKLMNKKIKSFLTEIKSNRYIFEESQCICGASKECSILVACYEKSYIPQDTLLCLKCGILYSSTHLNTTSLEEFYKNKYRSIFHGASNDEIFQDEVIKGKNIIRFIEPFFDCKNGGIVFDVGCGSGGVLLNFVQKGLKGYGCDLDGNLVNYGRKAGLNLIEGPFECLQRYSPADLVIASHILEHLPNIGEALQLIRNLLKDGGLLYVELPGILSSYKNYEDLIEYLQFPHLFHFTLRTLQNTVEKYGFELVKGDEYIHALFRKIPQTLSDTFENYTNNMMDKEILKILYYIKHEEGKLRFKNIVKVLKGLSVIKGCGRLMLPLLKLSEKVIRKL